MMDYDINSSWTRITYVTYDIESPARRLFDDLRPLGIMDNGIFYPGKKSNLRILFSEDSSEAKDLQFPEGRNERYVSYVGDNNGVICIAMGVKDLFLWNPSIKKSEKFPNLEIILNEYVVDDEDEDFERYYVVYGFGYDEVNDEYIVVSIVCRVGHIYRPTGEVKVYVCSTKKKSWRRIENFQGGYPWNGNNGTFLNGKLHWLVDNGLRGSIISLDLVTESYGTVDEPKNEDGMAKLGVFEECLCLLVCKTAPARTEVWVMKEYGVKESWMKVLSVRCNPLRNFMSIPLCVSPNGEYLLVLGRELGLYNPKDNTFKQLKDFVGVIYTASLYVESLAFPSANDAPMGQ
ncbi:hypothetical protein ACH5RR_032750 [Cinchona calisaya]|uniref:F-box associated beta-propeller type 3 domain-containing protein n=1 Tax=Cinchona calisaya TaxID=153742 RepID=A0ABD2YK49_9GENT